MERRTIVQDHPDCPDGKPWALVAGNGKVLGCHATEADAKTQEEAIKANESRDVESLRAELPERERRYHVAEVEIREHERGPQLAMWIPFNSESEEIFGFREVIRPGAFTKTVREADIVALWNHDPMWVLGRRSNKTLTIGLSDHGAEAVAQLDKDDRMHQHFARRVERRDVTGASFGFSSVRDKWGVTEDDGMPLRELLEVKLFDISPVTFPAYPESGSEKRSLVEVASARTGADVSDLVKTIAEIREGRIPDERRAVCEEWIKRLQGYLPSAPDDQLVAIRKRKLALLQRQVAIQA